MNAITEQLVKVRLFRPFRYRGGARFNAGEVGAFPPDVVEQIVEAGSGVVVEDGPAPPSSLIPQVEVLVSSGPQAAEAKAPAAPPVDKQIKTAPQRKKPGRRS